MNKNYQKKYNKNDLFLLNKYLSKFKIKSKNENIIEIYQTKNYKIEIHKNGLLVIIGSNFENILKMIGKNKVNEYKTNKINFKKNIIGSDEVGTGDTFGGITVCATYINDQNIEFLKKLKITDSKKYSNIQIENIYQKIKNKVFYEIVELSPIEYNQKYNLYKNLNIIKTYCHHQAIKKLLLKTNLTDYSCIIDQFTPLNNYKKYLDTINEKSNNNEITIIKAESQFLQVAAASIIARYYFIQQIKNLSNNLKKEIPFGSANIKVFPLIDFLKNKKINMNQYVKMHFKNIKK